jgi:hypothetical protein
LNRSSTEVRLSNARRASSDGVPGRGDDGGVGNGCDDSFSANAAAGDLLLASAAESSLTDSRCCFDGGGVVGSSDACEADRFGGGATGPAGLWPGLFNSDRPFKDEPGTGLRFGVAGDFCARGSTSAAWPASGDIDRDT